jgi:hypothetical protein
MMYHYTIASIECMIHLKPILCMISSRAFMQIQGQWKERHHADLVGTSSPTSTELHMKVIMGGSEV